jgi:hypothetical protein
VRRSVAAVLGVAALALVSLAPSSLRADGRKRVAILDVVIDGPSSDVAAQLETTIEEQLRRNGFEVVPHATTTEALRRHDELADGCSFGPCVAPIARALHVDRLLDIRVSADGQSYSFVISMVEGTQGAPIGQVVTSCGVCTVAEALSKMSAAVKAVDGGGAVADVRSIDNTPVVSMAPSRPSKFVPAFLIVSGLVLAGGGTAVVAGTDTHEPGWVGIGSGGTLLLTGLIMLATQD